MNERREREFTEYIELADHYKAIDNTEIFLWHPKAPPWEFVTEVKAGNPWRYEVPVSITFKAEHKCGLTFIWSMDVEDAGSNGAGSLSPNTPAIAAALQSLPKQFHPAMVATLALIAGAMQDQATKNLRYAETMFGKAHVLSQLIRQSAAVEEGAS